jgi:nucleotide-binding universal stress UspA family protein
MYSKIMVPLDGSELAECVFAPVEALAKGCQTGEIVFARAYNPFPYPIGAGEMTLSPRDLEALSASVKASAEDYIREVTERFRRGGFKVKGEVLVGPVAEALADYIAQNGIDLVVIATHGRSGVSRWVWGSVADRILRHSCAPVLMIRAPGCFPGF